jgi:hypothetical protein
MSMQRKKERLEADQEARLRIVDAKKYINQIHTNPNEM